MRYPRIASDQGAFVDHAITCLVEGCDYVHCANVYRNAMSQSCIKLRRAASCACMSHCRMGILGSIPPRALILVWPSPAEKSRSGRKFFQRSLPHHTF